MYVRTDGMVVVGARLGAGWRVEGELGGQTMDGEYGQMDN